MGFSGYVSTGAVSWLGCWWRGLIETRVELYREPGDAWSGM